MNVVDATGWDGLWRISEVNHVSASVNAYKRNPDSSLRPPSAERNAVSFADELLVERRKLFITFVKLKGNATPRSFKMLSLYNIVSCLTVILFIHLCHTMSINIPGWLWQFNFCVWRRPDRSLFSKSKELQFCCVWRCNGIFLHVAFVAGNHPAYVNLVL